MKCCADGKSEAGAAHGNLRFPELHDKKRLEALVRRHGTAGRVARVLKCNPQTVSSAMEKLGIEPGQYSVRRGRREK